MKDLYQLVNGPWLESHVIPDDRGVDGTFHALRDEAEELVHDIVQKDNGRPGKLYASFMDTEGVNAAGMAPLDADLDRLSAADPEELAQRLGELERTGVGSPVTFWVSKDSGSEDAIAYVIQSGLGLPDEPIIARKPTPKLSPPMKSMWQRCWNSSIRPAFSA